MSNPSIDIMVKTNFQTANVQIMVFNKEES